MENKPNGPSAKDIEKRLKGLVIQRQSAIVPLLVHDALCKVYLKANCGGEEVSGADAYVSRHLKKIVPHVRRLQTLEAFSAEAGVDPAYFRDQILMDLRDEKALRHFDPAVTNVSEAEIDAGLARLDAYTARAVASNRVTWATCSNALARVRSGVDFAAVNREFGGMDEEEAKEWGFFSRKELENDALRTWAFGAKVGEVGGPFDLDDGLSLVKVLKHEKGTAEDTMASAGVESVTLARITFPMIVEQPEPRTRDHCRRVLQAQNVRWAKKRLFEKLFGEVKIDYPNGNSLDFTDNEEDNIKGKQKK